MSLSTQIAIIEDDPSFLSFLELILKDEGYSVKGYTNPEQALKELYTLSPAIVITDLKMPKIDGLTLIKKLKNLLPQTHFIIITAFGDIPTAYEAGKLGVVGYLTKPLSEPEEVISRVKYILEQRHLSNKTQIELPPFDILFAGMEELFEKLLEVAPTPVTILLYGETGTGKSLIAKAIHILSGRKGPFIEINIPVVPETLIEAELFGYEKGAFTGAIKSKPGKLELAKGGTLFLDEIGELSPIVQVKILKLMQDKTFERLGSIEVLKTDARFIVATNKDLKTLIKHGKFREDLYYRINAFSFYIPPLRERKSHILKIAEYILKQKAQKYGKPYKPLSKNSIEILLRYSWPGNIRELENTLERGLILSKGEFIEIELDSEEEKKLYSLSNLKNLSLRELEKQAILSALKKACGNKKEAAKILGISLRTLYYKIKEYNLK